MKPKSHIYNQYLNEHILPFIDYARLNESYDTDMVYAKAVLNRLHEAMIEVYGSERIAESDGDEGLVGVPGILRGTKTGLLCLALFDIDLSSQGELLGAEFLYLNGVSSQLDEQDQEVKKILHELYVPYDYCYTADIPSDIHVNKSSLPEDLKDVLNDFRNHNIEKTDDAFEKHDGKATEIIPKSHIYEQYINEHILPFVDYERLNESYDTDMVYAKAVLNRLHEAMVEVYGSEQLVESDGDDEGFVVVPGVLRGIETELLCLALFVLDLSSQGELWGTDFLYLYGISSQLGEQNPEVKKVMHKLYVPYDYCYTADIPSDIHVTKSRLPDDLKDVLNDFRNHSMKL